MKSHFIRIQKACANRVQISPYLHGDMNTNIVIALDTRRAKSDGTFPLIMRLGHNRKTTSIPLGLSLDGKYWDEESRAVKRSYSGVTSVSHLNNLLQKKKSDAMDIILKLHEAGQLQTLSITDIRDRIASKDQSQSFYAFTQHLIAELIKANQIGTARSYKGVVSVLKTFHGSKELYFRDITYPFLSRFDTWHKSKGNGANGLSVYLRAIRAIYNKAIKSGLVEKETYPFGNYKIKSAPTEKRALEWDFIKRIIELNLDASSSCFNARNYFLASYMMYGMNFKDMACLEKTDIANGRIAYRRKKTGKIYDIKIGDNLGKILNYYIGLNPESKYIFPILKRDTPLQQDKDIQCARKRYNAKLKQLAALCGIDKKLTSYVSRHSFATQAMLQQVPLNAISAMLGHSSLKTTEIYLKSLPSNILDEYNARILH